MEAFTGRAGAALGPLTTTWTGMPASCTVHALICSTCSTAFQGQKCSTDEVKGEQIITDNSGCWPPTTPGAGTPPRPLAGWGYYSPGLVCPSGYSTACTAQHGGRSEWDVEFNLVAGETAIGCCPEGFHCTNLRGNTCMALADIGSPTVVAAGTCSGSVMLSAQATFPDLVTLTDTPGVLTRSMTLLAPMFQLNHQASDLPQTGASTTATVASETASPAFSGATGSGSTHDSSSASASVSAPPASASADGQGGGGLSTGAAAGVGVGATLGAVFLIAAVAAWVWRRKRRQRAPVAGPEGVGLAAENAPWEKQTPYSPSAPTELHAGYHGAEMYTSYPPAELPENLRGAPAGHLSDSPTYR